MKSFINTAFYAPTMTTVEDPLLKVCELDTGLTWRLYFYVGDTSIDVIDMERPRGNELHEDIKALRVFDADGNDIGSVEERVKYALDLDEGYDDIMIAQAIASSQPDIDIDFEDLSNETISIDEI